MKGGAKGKFFGKLTCNVIAFCREAQQKKDVEKIHLKKKSLWLLCSGASCSCGCGSSGKDTGVPLLCARDPVPAALSDQSRRT
jgi:hypothetical protein